jgi:hypothetical protein
MSMFLKACNIDVMFFSLNVQVHLAFRLNFSAASLRVYWLTVGLLDGFAFFKGLLLAVSQACPAVDCDASCLSTAADTSWNTVDSLRKVSVETLASAGTPSFQRKTNDR